jgi:hypothetical protein
LIDLNTRCKFTGLSTKREDNLAVCSLQSAVSVLQ